MSRSTIARRTQLKLEDLEGRITPAGIEVFTSYGGLVIQGTNANDTAVVYRGTDKMVWVQANGRYWRFSPSAVPHISFTGGPGNDYFRNDTSIPCTARGNDGNDTLIGGDGNDYLYGEGGSNLTGGRGGNDTIFGGDGPGTIYGGAGNDYLYGGGQNDKMYGQVGNDWLGGSAGNDQLFGAAGFDRLEGGFGNDILDGGVGDRYADSLDGGSGADWYRYDWFWNGSRWRNRENFVFFNASQGDRAFSNYA